MMKSFLVRTIVAGVIGAVLFWLYEQQFQNGNSIASFIGNQVVKKGGYSASPALIGWVVHLGVSFSYALMLGVIMMIPFSRSGGTNAVITLVIALVLGWVTTAIAVPAILTTVAILSLNEIPLRLGQFVTFDLTNHPNHPLNKHLIFFVFSWAVHLTGAGSKRRN